MPSVKGHNVSVVAANANRELTEEELILMQELFPEVFTTKKATLSTLPKKGKVTYTPYKLKITRVCKTCNAVYTNYFDMVVNADNTGLISRPTKDESMLPTDTESLSYCKMCSNCEKFLTSLHHDELVQMVLNLLSTRIY
jgi:hypothetical protein